jgi:5'-deoxynucleotidase
MAASFYALIARMRHIKRWGLMRNSFEENIQGHSHMTAVLAHALAVIRRDVVGKHIDPEKVAVVALFHDASEIITGDLPTPVKYQNPEIMSAYKQVERLAEEKLLKLLPEEMTDAYREVLSCGDQNITELVKAADKLSAYIKCVEERNAGNEEFKSAERQIKAILDDLKLPEVEYFMQHFMPAFGMTLDELII